MDQSLIDKITRVRRHTRSKDIMDICDALEKVVLVRPAPVSAPEQVRLRFDRADYQRNYMRGYMRKYRAKAKLSK